VICSSNHWLFPAKVFARFASWKVPVIELTMSIVVPFGISLTEKVAVDALRVPVDFTKTTPRGFVKKNPEPATTPAPCAQIR
jgi:hypothetical protein